MKALYFDSFGDSSVLQYGDVSLPRLTANEVLVETEYIGLNFADIYRRRGNYHIEKRTPYINGYEGSGVITEVGSEISKAWIGQRVLFVDVPFANAQYVAVPKEKIIHLPKEITTKTAATIGLQGLTADFLAHDLGKNALGEKAFVTGVSGGVGQLLAQLLIADGIEVSGSASTPEKQQTAKALGVKQVYPSRQTQWQEEVSDTFDTVYDGVGKTLNDSLQMIKHRGKVVFFGMAGGNPPQVDFIHLLSQSKSILTGDLWDYLTSYEERAARSERLFRYVKKGKVIVNEPTIFPLEQGKAAHDYLEQGKNSGKVLLKP